MLKNIQTVSVQVSDQDKAIDFYVNVLGFELLGDMPMDENSRWIEVAPAGAQTRIVLSKGYGPGEMGSFTGYIFSADDIKATCDTLKERGVKISVPLHTEAWGQWAQFADPDGNEFGIWAPVEEG